MVPGGVNELIWHFAGYLHLTPEVNGVPGVLYDGAGTHAIASDEGLGQGHGRAHERPDHLGSTRLSFAEFAAPAPYHWHLRPLGKFPHLPTIHAHLPKIALPKLPIPPLPPAGGGDTHLSVPVVYHEGGDPHLRSPSQLADQQQQRQCAERRRDSE